MPSGYSSVRARSTGCVELGVVAWSLIVPSPPSLRGSLQRLPLRDAGGERDHLPVLLVVGEDRREVALPEAVSVRGRRERLVDLALPVQLREVDGL